MLGLVSGIPSPVRLGYCDRVTRFSGPRFAPPENDGFAANEKSGREAASFDPE